MFLPFSFIGDFYDYGVFVDFINYRGDVAKMRPFSNFAPAFKRFCESLLCWWVFYQLGKMVDPVYMAKPEFLEYQMINRFFYMLLAANSRIFHLFARFSYHEACLVASGISYRASTKDAKEIFNTIRSVDIFKFHTAATPKDAIYHWNMRT